MNSPSRIGLEHSAKAILASLSEQEKFVLRQTATARGREHLAAGKNGKFKRYIESLTSKGLLRRAVYRQFRQVDMRRQPEAKHILTQLGRAVRDLLTGEGADG